MKRLLFIIFVLSALMSNAQKYLVVRDGIKAGDSIITSSELQLIPTISSKVSKDSLDVATETFYTKAQTDSIAALKASKAGDTFSGAVYVPTAAAGTNTTQAASTAFVNSTNNTLRAFQAAGSDIKAYSLGMMSSIGVSNQALTDGTMYAVPLYVDYSGTITGCRIVIAVQGSFTADNFNGIGLYSVSGGTCTKVAESSNDATIWTQPVSGAKDIAFTSPYAISSGLYYAVLLYNSSAQTTAPSVYIPTSGWGGNSITILKMTNSMKFGATLSGQTTLPSSFAFSSLTSSSAMPMVVLY